MNVHDLSKYFYISTSTTDSTMHELPNILLQPNYPRDQFTPNSFSWANWPYNSISHTPWNPLPTITQRIPT
jgi:hypothetical protein